MIEARIWVQRGIERSSLEIIAESVEAYEEYKRTLVEKHKTCILDEVVNNTYVKVFERLVYHY